MTTIKVGGTQVKVPETLDLEVKTAPVEAGAPHHHTSLHAHFRALFHDTQDPNIALPVPGHAVFILDTNRKRQFVHVAKYCDKNKNFESDGGWFETTEVDLWAYVPNAENERDRRISTV